MATKAYHISTFIFVLLLSSCLIHSATAARALTEGDKNTLGTRGEPYRTGTTSPSRGEPYTGRGTPRGIPSEPPVGYRSLNPNRPVFQSPPGDPYLGGRGPPGDPYRGGRGPPGDPYRGGRGPPGKP